MYIHGYRKFNTDAKAAASVLDNGLYKPNLVGKVWLAFSLL